MKNSKHLSLTKEDWLLGITGFGMVGIVSQFFIS